jgi:low temperature requirement protein LtrA
MRRRDPDEQHRASTPLELLFDLTFVVAVAHVAADFAHDLVEGHLGHGLMSYGMLFFAIWWAWMNFSWFASAYDCDDALYRVITAVQMAGVLVLAAGVDAAFEDKDFSTVVVGYVIMRVAMVTQWWRASIADPDGRDTARRYAVAILVVQTFWVLWLWFPESIGTVAFFVLVAAEMTLPIWAERPMRTTWHAEHIAERYGLFTIIVLGESVLASSNAVSADFADGGLTLDLVLLGIGGLVLLFGLWWIYFLHETGEALREQRDLDFLWGYSHYFVFASAAAVGAGLEASVEHGLHHVEGSARMIALVLAGAVAVYLVLVAVLHGRLTPDHRPSVIQACGGAVALVVVAVVVAPSSLPGAVLLFGVVVSVLVALGSRRTASSGAP